MAFSSVFQSFGHNLLELICDSQRNIGMTHGSRCDFFLYCIYKNCCVPQNNKDVQLHANIYNYHNSLQLEANLLHCLTEKEPPADFVRRIKLDISAATAEHMYVNHVPNWCANLACHRKTKSLVTCPRGRWRKYFWVGGL